MDLGQVKIQAQALPIDEGLKVRVPFRGSPNPITLPNGPTIHALNLPMII